METKYGIFMKIGDQKRYGDITGSGLVKMDLVDFDSEEAAIQYINTTAHFSSGSEFYILAFKKYRKPAN